jgi:hypothetical protein
MVEVGGGDRARADGEGGERPGRSRPNPPCPSFKRRRGWYSGAPAGRALPPRVTRRSCLPLPAASRRRTGPSSTAAAGLGVPCAGEKRPDAEPARTRRGSRVVPPTTTESRPPPPSSPRASAGPRLLRRSGMSGCRADSSTVSSRERSSSPIARAVSSNCGEAAVTCTGADELRGLGHGEPPVGREVLEGLHAAARPRHRHLPDDGITAEAEVHHGLAARHDTRGKAQAGAPARRARSRRGRSRRCRTCLRRSLAGHTPRGGPCRCHCAGS